MTTPEDSKHRSSTTDLGRFCEQYPDTVKKILMYLSPDAQFSLLYRYKTDSYHNYSDQTYLDRSPRYINQVGIPDSFSPFLKISELRGDFSQTILPYKKIEENFIIYTKLPKHQREDDTVFLRDEVKTALMGLKEIRVLDDDPRVPTAVITDLIEAAIDHPQDFMAAYKGLGTDVFLDRINGMSNEVRLLINHHLFKIRKK